MRYIEVKTHSCFRNSKRWK